MKFSGKSGNIFTLTESYVLGAGGEQISVVDGSGNWMWSNAYVGGQALATYKPDGLHWNLTDWQGTKRVQLTSAERWRASAGACRSATR